MKSKTYKHIVVIDNDLHEKVCEYFNANQSIYDKCVNYQRLANEQYGYDISVIVKE